MSESPRSVGASSSPSGQHTDEQGPSYDAGAGRPSPFEWAEPLSDDHIARVLVVAAHPDDADFGCSGTMAGWAAAGIAVTLVLCTRGDQGGFDDTARDAMPKIREAEQRAASAELGVTDVRFLDGFSDGWLEPNWDLQKQLVRVIREVRPQRVVCQSPDRNLRRLQGSHPDHLAAGEATVRAVYPAAENPFAWPELIEQGLPPWKVTELWVTAHPETSHVVDITDRFDRKLAALRAHASQTAHLGDQLEQMLRGWNGTNATRNGLPEGRLAESFVVTRIN